MILEPYYLRYRIAFSFEKESAVTGNVGRPNLF
jgi:hypothetical protein